METENVRKQLKISQNIFKMVWCVENANINIQSKFHESTFIYFRVTAKTKIDFVENRVCVKIPVFSLIFHLFFTALMKTTGKILLLTPQSTN
jgi:hypothetical protein